MTIRQFQILAVLWALGLCCCAVAGAQPLPAVETPSPPAFDHAIWDGLLATYVNDAGLVAYRDLQAKDAPALQRYLEKLATAEPEAWPPGDQIAFWINAYNAGMWWGVLQGQSAESLASRGPFFKAWEFPVAGQKRTPDEIEHEILRKRFSEPRIHFALVCVAMSCPPLRREAYRGDVLDAQLDDQARRFVNDPLRNIIDPEKSKVQLSMIFVWFKEDFAKTPAGSAEKYIAPYVAGEATRDWLLAGQYPVRHFNYDWTLNAQPEQRPWVKWSGAAQH